jgi:hypothetical protein
LCIVSEISSFSFKQTTAAGPAKMMRALFLATAVAAAGAATDNYRNDDASSSSSFSALRFQGGSAAAPKADPTVDPKTQLAGQPVRQKLNIGESTPLSPAMQSCLALVAVYYAMYLIGWLAGLRADLAAVIKGQALPSSGGGGGPSRRILDDDDDDERAGKASNLELMEIMMRQMADQARSTMLLIPMLTILIVFARLRAKVDLEGTNPPEYARKAFYGATAIIYVQAFQSFCFSMFKNCAPGGAYGLTICQNLLGFLCTVGVYACIIVIFLSILNLTKTAPGA